MAQDTPPGPTYTPIPHSAVWFTCKRMGVRARLPFWIPGAELSAPGSALRISISFNVGQRKAA